MFQRNKLSYSNHLTKQCSFIIFLLTNYHITLSTDQNYIILLIDRISEPTPSNHMHFSQNSNVSFNKSTSK